MKAIIVYYSFTGHTKEVANKLASILNCDVEELKLKNGYSGSDDEINKITESQVTKKETPELFDLNKDLSNYDTILLGSPVWWFDVPPAIRSFLCSYDLSNKSVYPFITNGGNVGNIVNTLKEYISNLDVSKVLCMNFDLKDLNINKELNNWISNIF